MTSETGRAVGRKRRARRANRWGGTLLGAIFMLAGTGAIVPMFFLPLRQIEAARTWRTQTCTVLSSEVVDHGDTHSIGVRFVYQVDGHPFESDRYSFETGSSSGYAGKAEVVARLPPGAAVTCYVNPQAPHEAVIHRDRYATLWLGLFPLVFVFAGLGLLVMTWRKPRPPSSVAGSSKPALSATGLTLLQPESTPGLRLGVAIVLALFWNGIISVFLLDVVAQWQKGNRPWFDSLFLSPFVLIGLGFVGFVFHSALALRNPRPRLALDPPLLTLGETAYLEWTIDGAVTRLHELTITLEGREEATYVRGDKRRTERLVFHRQQIHGRPAGSVDQQGTARTGNARFELPADSMHSFAGSYNKIVWAIKVNGSIARWPDLDETFPVAVEPRRPSTFTKRQA